MAEVISRRTASLDRRTVLRGVATSALAAGCGIQPGMSLARVGNRPPESATLSSRTLYATEAVIARYEAIARHGGWPYVPPGGQMRVGLQHRGVATLRQRMMIEGDLDPRDGMNEFFDAAVESAVRSFQTRHGIAADGIVDAQTFAALNVPAQIRAQQLQVNVVRLRSLSGELGARYVMCNLPAAEIEAIENGVAVSRHAAIVGKPDRPSPDIQSRIIEVNFNPFWTVPVSIVRRDLIPRMQAEPDYLVKNRIRIIDANGNELSPAQINWYSDEAVNYRFKQDPGDFNSLGSMRINFPSAHGVYMHDTPYKNLFGDDFRFHSSGCVRVQNIRQLVYWLLAETSGWPPQAIDAAIRSGDRRDAKVEKPVPLYWVYITAWATNDGVVQFRNDIYGRDGMAAATALPRG